MAVPTQPSCFSISVLKAGLPTALAVPSLPLLWPAQASGTNLSQPWAFPTICSCLILGYKLSFMLNTPTCPTSWPP